MWTSADDGAARPDRGRAGGHRRRDHAPGLAAARARAPCRRSSSSTIRRGSSALAAHARLDRAGRARSRAPEDAVVRLRRRAAGAAARVPAHRSCRAGPIPANAAAVIAAITTAVTLVMARRAAAIVTNPIQKETLYAAGFPHPGHTEFLGALAGGAPAGDDAGLPGPARRAGDGACAARRGARRADARRRSSPSAASPRRRSQRDFGIARPAPCRRRAQSACRRARHHGARGDRR